MRLLLPYAMKKLTEKMIKKAQQGQGGFTYTYGSGSPFGNQNPYGQQQKEHRNSQQADTTLKVDYVPHTEEKRKGTQTAGEFIDFEEVK